jgi:hypothetical protein
MGQPVPKGGGRYHIGEPYQIAGVQYEPKADPEKQRPRAVVARASPHRRASGGRPSRQQTAEPLSDDKSLSIQVGSFKAACFGVNSKTGKRQSVQQVYKTRISHKRRFFAETTHHHATGRPLIVYYRRYAAAPGYFKTFIRAHECCHHSGNRNEIAANCCALRRMQLSKGGLLALRRYIVSQDVNSQTANDYRGQGLLFWSKTASSCVSYRRR